MKKNEMTSLNRVPFGQKVAFGLGMLANQMFPAALGIFMVVLVQDLKFPTWMWGILFFLPRIFDSIIDPIMGFISDNTRSVWGRRRQYVFIGSIIMGIAFILMWQLYRSSGINYNFIYFLFWSFVFYLGLTIFSIPYVAMGYEMSDDFHERTSIMAVSQWIGQWAWVIAPWFWVIMYDPKWFPNADSATRELAIWVGLFCSILAMIPAIFIKSKSTKDDTKLIPLTVRNIGVSMKEILRGFVDAFKLVPFRKLCISTFLIFNAFNTVASFSFFIVVYYLFNGDTKASGIWPTLFGSVGALVTTFVVIPIVAKMSKKMGKKKAFMLSQGTSVLGYILLWFLFIPGKPYMFLFALPFFSFGIGGLFTLMMSMTADVCDLDEINTGKRREGIFGAIYWWMVKFGFAIAGLLSGFIMWLVDFTPNATTQVDGAVNGLRLFYSGIPILGTLLAMYIMRNYDLSEEKAREVQKELQRRKKVKEELSTGYREDVVSRDFSIYPRVAPNYSDSELEAAFKNTLNKGIHGICFAPFDATQKPGECITEEQIRRRLQIIKPYTQWIRIFSCTKGHELIPAIAHEMGLKTLVGAWISRDEENNNKEIDSLIHLINKGHVDIAAVGNEVIYREELPKERIISYMMQVKQETQNVPIGYVDLYSEYAIHPDLVEIADIVLINSYPYWEGCPQENAFSYLKKTYEDIQSITLGKEVIITETGWPSFGDQFLSAYPNQRNAMEYFIQIQQWSQSNNIRLFYFSSFDEPWKEETEGSTGAYWGLWDKNESLKF